MNLCLQYIARDSKCTKEAKVQKQHEDSPTSGIEPLCPTRWTVCTTAMQGILYNYLSLQERMESFSHGTDDCSQRGSGMLALTEKFQTYFGLKLHVLVFGITEQLISYSSGNEY